MLYGEMILQQRGHCHPFLSSSFGFLAEQLGLWQMY